MKGGKYDCAIEGGGPLQLSLIVRNFSAMFLILYKQRVKEAIDEVGVVEQGPLWLRDPTSTRAIPASLIIRNLLLPASVLKTLEAITL
jgi:hypothetical protein